MNNQENRSNKYSGLKKNLLEWGSIGAVILLLYATGLHTEVMGTMQRALLWTGLFDAHKTEIEKVSGPYLSEQDFNFPLVTADGKNLQLEDFRGKVLFINLWASWCPPCVAEMPTIQSLYSEVNSKDVKFLLISLDDKRKKAIDFMEDGDYSIPYYFPASRLPVVFQSPYLPTTYVVSKEGQVIYKKEGIADYSSAGFRDWIHKLAGR